MQLNITKGNLKLKLNKNQIIPSSMIDVSDGISSELLAWIGKEIQKL